MSCLSRKECLSRHETVEHEKVSVHDLHSFVQTGDVILFSTRDTGAKCIQRFTRSVWNHVAMVVRPSSNQTYCIEWGGGLIVQPLVDRLHDYHHDGARTLALRKLILSGNDRIQIESKLEMFVFRLLTDPSRVDNDIFPLSTVIPFAVHRSLRSSEDVVDDLSELFCSKTVAVCFKHVGLLSKNIDANGVFPKHFAHPRDKTMAYSGGRLGPEVEITFEPKALKEFADKLIMMPLRSALARFTPHERSAATIQRCVRRWRASALRRQRQEGAVNGGVRRRGMQSTTLEMRTRFAELSQLHAELLEGLSDLTEDPAEDGSSGQNVPLLCALDSRQPVYGL